MTILTKTFGIAARNFTAYPEMPDPKALIEYGEKVEALGYDSLWVWDHILLGVEPNFPIMDSLTTLTTIGVKIEASEFLSDTKVQNATIQVRMPYSSKQCAP